MRLRGWLGPAALLALAPKCIVCLLAYPCLGIALGLGGPELCGATPPTLAGLSLWWLTAGGAILGVAALRRRRA